MMINRTTFLDASAMALDFIEMDTLKAVTNHNRRIALISIKIGRELGFDELELSDLHVFAIFHDNGKAKFPTFGDSYVNNTDMTGLRGHCIVGERNIEGLTFFKKRSNILLYHHEEFDGSGPFGIKGDDIPLFSQIIHFADVSEVIYRNTESREAVIQNAEKNRKSHFSDRLLDAFMKAQKKPAFWFGLDYENVRQEVLLSAPHVLIPYDTKRILAITELLAKIIDGKSPFTCRHTSELAQKAVRMAGFYNFDRLKTDKFKIAADMHDIGKLAVPNRILEKPGPLSSEEYFIMKRHTYLTRIMTSFTEGFSDISEWAWMHHENLDGTGYPCGITGDEMPFESQLMAVLDKYQALTEDRPYRKHLSHEKALSILRDLAKHGKINKAIVEDVDTVFSDGDLA
jgi:HD-GYP domain-containing protein (c-di-GMP phosphodiesterase class II)